MPMSFSELLRNRNKTLKSDRFRIKQYIVTIHLIREEIIVIDSTFIFLNRVTRSCRAVECDKLDSEVRINHKEFSRRLAALPASTCL